MAEAQQIDARRVELEVSANEIVNAVMGDGLKIWADKMAYLLVLEDTIRQKTDVFRKV